LLHAQIRQAEQMYDPHVTDRGLTGHVSYLQWHRHNSGSRTQTGSTEQPALLFGLHEQPSSLHCYEELSPQLSILVPVSVIQILNSRDISNVE
jgi:hypothetical protein